MSTVKIWVMEIRYGTFWKEHGQMAWSKNIRALMHTIKDGYEVRYCDEGNKSEVQWD